MSLYLIWLITAIVILAAEMMAGTVYLLALFAGAALASAAAFMGASLSLQLCIAAVATVIGVLIAFKIRLRIKKNEADAKDNNLDGGNQVMVDSIDEDGSARVMYRGTTWKAFARDGILEKGLYKIDRVEGTRLIIYK